VLSDRTRLCFIVGTLSKCVAGRPLPPGPALSKHIRGTMHRDCTFLQRISRSVNDGTVKFLRVSSSDMFSRLQKIVPRRDDDAFARSDLPTRKQDSA